MTRNNETSYRSKGRAVFLAAIMVLSVIAVPAAFAGGAAATADKVDTYGNSLAGNQVYQGQGFQVTNLNDSAESSSASFNEPGDNVKDGTTELHLVEITDRSGSSIEDARQIRPVSYDNTTNNGQVTLDTSDLETGEYALSNETGVSGKILTPFTVTEQEFSAEIDDDSVTGNDNTTVELSTSNRPALSTQNVTVSVDGPDDFGASAIKQLFNVSNGGTVTEEAHLPMDHLDYDRSGSDTYQDLEDDGYVTINLSATNYIDLNSDDELEMDFRNLSNTNFPDDGDYEFEFIITDSAATSTDTVSISEADESASFSEGVTRTPAGDISEFEIEFEDTSDGYVQIGSEESDFIDVLYIEADDSSEPVTVQVNTRLLGTGAPTDAVYDRDNAATFESEFHDGGITSPSGIDLYEDDGSVPNGDSFTHYLDNIGIIDHNDGENYKDQLTRPLQPTDYEIVAAGTTGEDTAVFDADPGGEANNQLDSKVMELSQPEIGSITTHTAPGGSANDETELDPLLNAATQREEIAVEDRLVVQVEATGIYGAMVGGAGSNQANVSYNWDRLDDGVSTAALNNIVDNSNESIDFSIAADSATGNQDPLEVDLSSTSDSDSYVVIDNDGGQFFVVVDTSSDAAFANGEAPDEEKTFTAELTYDADNDENRFELQHSQDDTKVGGAFSVREGSYVNYPYLLQGETLSSSTEFDLAPRSISFDNVNVDEVLEAENVEGAEISGTTNVAPGSDASIRVSSTDASSAFRNGQDVNISEDGTISTTFDFSGQEVGDQFSTSYQIGGSTVDEIDSVLVEEGSLGTAPPEDEGEDDMGNETDDSTDESSDDSTDESSDDSTDESSSDSTDESTDDNTPGFGAIVALVALIGAALLATRRQD